MKRSIVGLLVAMLLPLMSVVVEAARAHACSCLGSTEAQAFADADAVFVGRLTGYEPPPFRSPSSSLDPAVWTFKVREVYEGDVTRKQHVVSAVSGASCGLEIPKHGTFLVFARSASTRHIEPSVAEGQLQAGLCGGTRVLADGAVDPSLGKPYPPSRNRSKHR